MSVMLAEKAQDVLKKCYTFIEDDPTPGRNLVRLVTTPAYRSFKKVGSYASHCLGRPRK